MTDSFTAKVVSGSGKKWIVQPQIVEVDGTAHPSITVSARDGVTPSPGDMVLVLTMRNNLDEKTISRFFEASESNGVIVGVLTAVLGYKLTGNYTFVGDMLIQGNVTVAGNITAAGAILGATVAAGPVDLATVNASLLALIATVTANQDLYIEHTHAVITGLGAPGTTGAPV